MWQSGLLKRVGDLLDAADDTASSTDLQTFTRSAASGAVEAATSQVSKATGMGTVDSPGKFDLGLADGWQELKNQIGNDIKDFGSKWRGTDEPAEQMAPESSRAMERASDSDLSHVAAAVPCDEGPTNANPKITKTAQLLADLREHIKDLESREEERLKTRSRAEDLHGELLSEIQGLQAKEKERIPKEEGRNSGLQISGAGSEHAATLRAMRSELSEQLASTDARISALEAELAEVSIAADLIAAELQLWRDKTQQALATRGLDGTENQICTEDESADASSRLDSLESELEQQQGTFAGLEGHLAELMRGSDAAVTLVDLQRRRERELQAALATAETSAASQAAAAEAARQRLKATQEAKAEASRKYVQERHKMQTNVSDSSANSELSELRRRAEKLRSSAQGLTKENSLLEGRLRKYRAAAAADLERAVPLSAPSCWRCIDGPSLKAATLLVRSGCLRRIFTLHLLVTYLWLFFLIFWLEKHP